MAHARGQKVGAWTVALPVVQIAVPVRGRPPTRASVCRALCLPAWAGG